MMDKFEPFDRDISTTLSSLTIESDEEKLVLYGSLQINRDKSGLNMARRLSAILAAAVHRLEAEKLPDQVAPVEDGPVTDNPFE